MTQDGLKHKDKDLAKMKKHILELLSQAWTKGYIAGCNDGYATGRDAFKPKEGEAALKSQEDKKTKKCPNCGSDLIEYCGICGYEGEEVSE